MATHFRIPAGKKPNGQRSLAGYDPWGCKESNMTEVTDHHHHMMIDACHYAFIQIHKTYNNPK